MTEENQNLEAASPEKKESEAETTQEEIKIKKGLIVGLTEDDNLDLRVSGPDVSFSDFLGFTKFLELQTKIMFDAQMNTGSFKVFDLLYTHLQNQAGENKDPSENS